MSASRLTVLLAAGVALLAPAPALAAGREKAVPDELLVRFVRSADAGDRAALRDRADVELKRVLPLAGLQLVEVEPGQSRRAAERALEDSREVAYAEPNFYRRAYAVPNDPRFGELWGLENRGQAVRGVSGTPDADVDAPEAWEIMNGGARITTAVIDSGVDFGHPELAPQMWRNVGETGSGRESNGRDDDGNGLVDDWRGWDWVEDDNDPLDQNGHGTHVSGTIAAETDNGAGIAGLSSSARVMALRVLDALGSGTVADLLAAYRYAAANGARVVNLSLGGAGPSQAERDLITGSSRTLFVIAAGNGGLDGVGDDNDATPEYPCAYPAPNIVCVAASDQNDKLAPFSNFGESTVDLAAPGVRILSTWPGGSFTYSSGTSMATPHVAATASSLMALGPDAPVAEVKSQLLAGTEAMQAFVGKAATGGRLNAERVLRQADPAATPASPAPAPRVGPAPTPPAPDSSSAPPASPAARAPSAPVIDQTAPVASLRVLRGQSVGSVLRRGLRLGSRCSERCKLRVRLLLGSRAARRLRVAKSGGQAVVGRRAIALRTRNGRLTVKLSRAARLRLSATRRLTLLVTMTASDAAGNKRSVRARATLRR